MFEMYCFITLFFLLFVYMLKLALSTKQSIKLIVGLFVCEAVILSQCFHRNENKIIKIIAYQKIKHTFNRLNTLHVTFTIPRYRL